MAQIWLVDVREGAQLYVLGGVPRSGKTMLAGRLWREANLPGMCMDSIVSAFIQVAPEAGVGWDDTVERAQKVLVAAQMTAIPSLQTFGRYFLEGESLTPLVADALRKNFQVRACFLTMSQPRIDDIVRYEGVDAWIRDLPTEQQQVFAAQVSERSRDIETQCTQLGFQTVDVSIGDYEDRAADVMNALVGANAPVAPRR